MYTITNLIPHGQKNAITRKELCTQTGLSDRMVRLLIEKARKEYCILNLGDGGGYFQPEDTEKELIYIWIRQEMSRISKIEANLQEARNCARWME